MGEAIISNGADITDDTTPPILPFIAFCTTLFTGVKMEVTAPIPSEMSLNKFAIPSFPSASNISARDWNPFWNPSSTPVTTPNTAATSEAASASLSSLATHLSAFDHSSSFLKSSFVFPSLASSISRSLRFFW